MARVVEMACVARAPFEKRRSLELLGDRAPDGGTNALPWRTAPMELHSDSVLDLAARTPGGTETSNFIFAFGRQTILV